MSAMIAYIIIVSILIPLTAYFHLFTFISVNLFLNNPISLFTTIEKELFPKTQSQRLQTYCIQPFLIIRFRPSFSTIWKTIMWEKYISILIPLTKFVILFFFK